jgi:hypothetical protein
LAATDEEVGNACVKPADDVGRYVAYVELQKKQARPRLRLKQGGSEPRRREASYWIGAPYFKAGGGDARSGSC